jgi:hypothetical protein
VSGRETMTDHERLAAASAAFAVLLIGGLGALVAALIPGNFTAVQGFAICTGLGAAQIAAVGFWTTIGRAWLAVRRARRYR